VQWTVFENKQLAIWQTSNWPNNPSEPYANRALIAKTYANLGWIGIHPSQVHANLG
jgi:hypothetical protein